MYQITSIIGEEVVLQLVARAEVPEKVAAALTQSSLVALQKPDGILRGIAVVEVLRRVAARTLASTVRRSRGHSRRFSSP